MAIVTEADVFEELGLCPPTAQEVEAVKTALIKSYGAIKRALRYDPVARSRAEYYPQRDYTVRELDAKETWPGTTTLFRPGKYSDEFIVQHIPVRTVWSLWVQTDGWSDAKPDAFTDEDLWVEGEDFWPNYDITDLAGQKVSRCGIMRTTRGWPNIPGSIKIHYYAGFTPAELAGESTFIDASPIWEAMLNETARRVKRTLMNQKRTGLGFINGTMTSERLGDYSYTLGASSKASEDTYGYMSTGAGSGDILPSTRDILADWINWGYPLAC